MPFDGNGNWTSTFSAQADKAAGYKILASRFDNIFIADLATSFENCLTKDAQVKPTQAFDANSYKVINVGDPTNNQDAVNKRTMDSAFSDISTDLFKPGMVVPFAGSTAPSGWLICDGSAISRTTYSALFAVIGTTYGAGDGSTTFNIPDFISKTILGRGGSESMSSWGSLPKITGSFPHNIEGTDAFSGTETNGCFRTVVAGTSSQSSGAGDRKFIKVYFDSSYPSSSVYTNTNNRVYPAYQKAYFIIKY